MIKFLMIGLLSMAIVPKPIKMPDDIKKYCQEHKKDCGII